MLQGTQEGDFSDCCDGRAIAFFRGIDPDCLECYDCAGAAVAGTAHGSASCRLEATRLLQMLRVSLVNGAREGTSFADLVEFFEFVNGCCSTVEAC